MRTLPLLLVLLLFTSCSPDHVREEEQRAHGRYNEVHTWTATVPKSAGRQRVDVGLEIDPAQLMGWARSDQQYRIILDVTASMGEEQHTASLLLPVTEMVKVRDEGDTRVMRFRAAGKITQTGFRRGPLKTALSFRPSPGEWTLTLRLRTPSGADRSALKAVRTLRLAFLSSSPERELPWTYQGITEPGR